MQVNITTTNFTTLTIRPIWNFFKSQLTSKAKETSQNSSQMWKFTTLLEANNKQTLCKKRVT